METLQHIYDWYTTGIYEFATAAMAQITEWMVIGFIKTKIFMVTFFWDIAKNILINLGLSQLIEQSWSTIPPNVMGALSFFKLPEAVNILLQAITTRFSLRFFGL